MCVALFVSYKWIQKKGERMISLFVLFPRNEENQVPLMDVVDKRLTHLLLTLDMVDAFGCFHEVLVY